MFWYILLAVSPLGLGLICDQFRYNRGLKRDDKQKTMLILFGIMLFAIIALRHPSIGSTDSQNYYNNWELFSGYNFSEFKSHITKSNFEIGYLVSVWLLSRVFVNPQFVFVFSGLLFSVAVCRFVYKNSENQVLSCIMYVTIGGYIFMVQGLRQAVAMSILLFAVEYCKKRKIIPFLGLIVLASLFHITAIVFVVTYFIYGVKLTTKNKLIFLAAGIVVLLTSIFWVEIGNKLLGEGYGKTAESGGLIEVAIYAITILVSLLFAADRAKEKSFAFFFYISFIGMIIYIMRYVGTMAAERVSFYFMFARMIILPSVIKKFDRRSQYIINTIVGALCVLLCAYRLNGSDLVPYKFFWQ